MKISLTKSEMLALWRRATGIDPAIADCDITRVDGFDLDATLTVFMRSWYLHLLDTAPLSQLAPTDIARLFPAGEECAGWLRVQPPPQMRRLVSMRLSGWERPASPEPLPQGVVDNPFCLPTPQAPRVFLAPDGFILAGPAAGTMASAICVTDMGEDVYSFDDSIIGSLGCLGNLKHQS